MSLLMLKLLLMSTQMLNTTQIVHQEASAITHSFAVAIRAQVIRQQEIVGQLMLLLLLLLLSGQQRREDAI